MKKKIHRLLSNARMKKFHMIQLFSKHQNLGTIIFIATFENENSLQNTVSHPLGKDGLKEIFN